MENTLVIDGITISYIEKNSTSDKIIFFIHGNSSSAITWEKQFQDQLFQNYRLIAINLPGHGNSSFSKNANKDYSPMGTADIASKLVKILSGSKKYILVGSSYGTNVVAEMIAMGIKPEGIVLIGACILGKNYGMEKVFTKSTEPSIFTYNEGDKNVAKKFLGKQFSSDEKQEIRSIANDYFLVDPNFKPALFKGAAEGKISDEIEALKTLNIPVVVLFGENDQLVNNDYLDDAPISLWNKTVYKVPGASHWPYLDKPEETNKIIADYTAEIFRSVHA